MASNRPPKFNAITAAQLQAYLTEKQPSAAWKTRMLAFEEGKTPRQDIIDVLEAYTPPA